MLSMKWFLVLLAQSLREGGFLDAIAEAIAEKIRKSARVNSAMGQINAVLDKIDGVVNDDNPKTYLVRRLVVAQLTEMAQRDEKLARAMNYAEFLPAVLDGVTIDEVLSSSKPVKALIADKAFEVIELAEVAS